MILDIMTPVYFCVYRAKADWSWEGPSLNPGRALYINDLWVAMLNFKLHKYNLAFAQEITLRTVKKIDCNAHTMEPIKYEFRVQVSYTINIIN